MIVTQFHFREEESGTLFVAHFSLTCFLVQKAIRNSYTTYFVISVIFQVDMSVCMFVCLYCNVM